VTERRSFRAMGTAIELLVEADGAHAQLDAAEAEFERLEQVMSRFRANSELSSLNRDGALDDASADLVDVVALALEARAETQGRFDPTVHDALVAAGYDRTFVDVAADGAAAGRAACGGRVEIDGRRIALAPGVRLDLGGIGKGYAAERAAELLAVAGPCLVDAGGDVAVRGTPASGVWPVAVDGGPTLGLERGGLATSGRDRRRWRRGGREVHHLIDPSTGRPAASEVLRVTAVAGDAVAAEVLAKVLFLGGVGEAARRRATAIFVFADGRTILTGELAG
jgi:FAD:protein FMN transferase